MDRISAERRSANMRAIRSKDTKPELIVRKLLHGMGFRYRLHRGDLPGKPDIAFIGRRRAIFVHGCFWHQHPDPACRDARPPRSNSDYWAPKLARNLARDVSGQRDLARLGWQVLVLWECELKDLEAVEGQLLGFLGDRR